MAAIIVGLCCLSSMAGGGYLAYTEIKKSQEEEEKENRITGFKRTPGLHLFTECEYKGEHMHAEQTEEAIIDTTIGFKSFILTSDYKVDTYPDADLQGTKMTYTGPANMPCITTSIKSARFYKA